jgi:hypothetical protein
MLNPTERKIVETTEMREKTVLSCDALICIGRELDVSSVWSPNIKVIGPGLAMVL